MYQDILMTLPAGNILSVIARRSVLFVLFVCFRPTRLGLGRGCSSTQTQLRAKTSSPELLGLARRAIHSTSLSHT